jgi:magnesium chelatase family protein
VVAARVLAARKIQVKRSGTSNASLGGAQLAEAFDASDECFSLLERAAENLALSARAYQRVQRVARTIADLAGEKKIATMHVAEALRMRQLDRGVTY